ncbi:MAG: alkaline phosphatase family protein [Hyphomicrobiales bacterium]
MNFSIGRTGQVLATGRAALLALLAAASALIQAASAQPEPRVGHIVVVVMENHSYAKIIRNGEAPFINALAKSGAVFVNSHGVRKPSQPNYRALFSGSTQGVKDDKKHSRSGPTLATALAEGGKRFVGYAERNAARRHRPWQTFKGQASYEQDLSRFPKKFDLLPDVSFVIPNLRHNMHDGSVRAADDWLKSHLGEYVNYCRDHRCLLILTFDEPRGRSDDSIPTIITGSQVKSGVFAQRIDHYSVLRTITDAMGIGALGESAKAEPIFGIWDTDEPQ